MVKILHTADWQIGRQYRRFLPEDGAAIAEARFRTVEKIAALAADREVDAVLVAGDVFDAQSVSDRTIRRLFHAMAGYSGPWVMISGNHDAALAESVWSRAERLGAIPGNVHVLLEAAVREFPDLGIAILPAPLSQRHTYQDLTAWFDGAETVPGLLRIGLAHGGVEGILAEDIDSANPIAANRAEVAGLDYLALGDWHGCRQIDARTAYSGSPEQDRFKDNGAGFVLEVTFTGTGAEPQVTPIETTEFRWHHLQPEFRVESDLEQFLQTLESIPKPAVIQVTLSGEIDLASHQRLMQVLEQEQAKHRSLQWQMDGLRFAPTEADMVALHADGFVGEVITELRGLQSGEQTETASDALAILTAILMRDGSGMQT